MREFPPADEDTSAAARALQLELYRRMTPGEKLAIVLDLVDTAESFARAGLRLRHPDEDEAALTLRLAALKYGPDFVREHAPFLAPE